MKKKLIIASLIVFVGWFFYSLVWHIGEPYNTEIVCFNKEGNVVLYFQGYRPGDEPVIHLNDDNYKIKNTGEKLKATCKTSWGVSKPKGRDYYIIENTGNNND